MSASRPRTRLQKRQEEEAEEKVMMNALVGYRPEGVRFALPAKGKLQVLGATPFDHEMKVQENVHLHGDFEGDIFFSAPAEKHLDWTLKPGKEDEMVLRDINVNSYLVLQKSTIHNIQTFTVQGVKYLCDAHQRLVSKKGTLIAERITFHKTLRIYYTSLMDHTTLRVTVPGVLSGEVEVDCGGLYVHTDQPGLSHVYNRGGTVCVNGRIRGEVIQSSTCSITYGMTCTAPKTSIRCEASSDVRDFVCRHAEIICRAHSTVEGQAHSWSDETDESSTTKMTRLGEKPSSSHHKGGRM